MSKSYRIARVLYGEAHVAIEEANGTVDLACSRQLEMPTEAVKRRVFISDGTAENITCSVCKKNSGLDDSVVLRKPGKARKV
jgi:hypothetical protein